MMSDVEAGELLALLDDLVTETIDCNIERGRRAEALVAESLNVRAWLVDRFDLAFEDVAVGYEDS